MIEDNSGQIRIESQEGQGTKVILTFPVKTDDK
jgi:signal transduction histidine kinase